ncbi:MAG: excinuclease ABC subunit UvrA [Flavobacteriales bacterium AspAUS03]
MDKTIRIYGAREHNLKNIDLEIPRDRLVVITGLSGSGKSSLAFDTLYAEGQRRYLETLSAYARQFLGGLDRPNVDKIDGLSPVIAIEQKTTSKNPRSTIGTIIEIYDFLRLLYARIADAYSYVTGEKMISHTETQLKKLIFERYQKKKIAILAPVVKSRKGHYRELFESVRKRGFLKARIDGTIVELSPGMQLDRYKNHDIEILIDCLELQKDEGSAQRLKNSIATAMHHGEGVLMILEQETNKPKYFSKHLMCPKAGIAYPTPEPNTFSFNSPKGACLNCKGLGIIQEVNLKKIIPDDTISIDKGGIQPIDGSLNPLIFQQLEIIAKNFQFSLKDPINKIPSEALQAILYGMEENFSVNLEFAHVTKAYEIRFEGIIPYVKRMSQGELIGSASLSKYMEEKTCPDCSGMRLRKESRFFKIKGKSITEVARLDIGQLDVWVNEINDTLSERHHLIAQNILKELRNRIGFLLKVGLDYLSLDRPTKTLSGGEAQRIRLATQIGSQLVNVLYILDEPSIGLHQKDNHLLISALKQLTAMGNSTIVVEHDRDIIEQADHIIDLGPGAGQHGGVVIFNGSPEALLKADTSTAKYIRRELNIPFPNQPRKGNGQKLILKGACGNNLKKVTLHIPLGKMVCMTGVSGSGKSSLINETLFRILNRHFYHAEKEPLPYESITGLEYIDKVIDIDQSPIGRTPRSNPATYTGVFLDIRKLFSEVPESKIRGYKPGRFSFNMKGGRCETCEGAGLQTIEMNFLPDIQIRCEKCQGKRFNKETLEVRYKGKSIADVLEMTIEKTISFFEPIPGIHAKVKCLQEVGLGYLSLGQSSVTLSGGEAQRVKLATELSRKQTGKTFYILDEPTTGLHFEDIRILMELLNCLTDLGNTVLIIEHNLNVVKIADHIIDMGPDGGQKGGEIIAEGLPEQIAGNPQSHTGKFLKKELNAYR